MFLNQTQSTHIIIKDRRAAALRRRAALGCSTQPCTMCTRAARARAAARACLRAGRAACALPPALPPSLLLTAARHRSPLTGEVVPQLGLQVAAAHKAHAAVLLRGVCHCQPAAWRSAQQLLLLRRWPGPRSKAAVHPAATHQHVAVAVELVSGGHCKGDARVRTALIQVREQVSVQGSPCMQHG